MESLRLYLESAGIPVYFIFISGFFLVVLAIDRYRGLFIKLSANCDETLGRVRDLVLTRKYTDALQVCNLAGSAPQLDVTKAALLGVESGREAVKSNLNGAYLSVQGKAEERLSFIALIASAATLLGLLGTITGLIKTFEAIASADPAEKAKLLGLGISEAMSSTAIGLVIGIAALVLHTICTNRAEKILNKTQDAGFKVLAWIEQSERGQA